MTTFVTLTNEQIKALKDETTDKATADLCRLALGQRTKLKWSLDSGQARIRVAEIIAAKERATATGGAS